MSGDAAHVLRDMAGDPRVRIAGKPVNPAQLLQLMRLLLAS